MRLIITNCHVADDAHLAAEPVDILIDNGEIVEIGRALASREGGEGAEVLDAQGQIVLPGFTNAHTHAHANLVRASAGSWSLEDLLNYGPAVYGSRNPEEQYLSAALGAIEMVRLGCTSAYDLFAALPGHDDESLDAVAQAYVDVGFRATIAPAIADIPFLHSVPGLRETLPPEYQDEYDGMQAPSADELLGVTERFITRWHGKSDGLIGAAIAPTIPGQCTDELLQGCRTLSEEYGVGIHTHLAESKVQTVRAHERWGTTIVGALDRMGIIGPGFVGAHAIWLTPDDIATLGDKGATVAHNPASNLRLGNGISPVRLMADAGVNLSIGTDGSICSDNQNMFEAMKLAALVSSVPFPFEHDRWITAKEVYAMATQGGAQALGLANRIGKVAKGYKADLVLVDPTSVGLSPRGDLETALVFAESGASVRSTIINGRVVMREGVIQTVDEAALRTRAVDAAENLHSRNRSRWTFPERIRPYLTAACRDAFHRPHSADFAWSVQGGTTT